jgi:hypothetical protein
MIATLIDFSGNRDGERSSPSGARIEPETVMADIASISVARQK